MIRAGCDRCKGSPGIGVYWLCSRCRALVRPMVKRVEAQVKAQTPPPKENEPHA